MHPIAASAAHQYGVITRRQLLALGVPPRTIDDRLRAGTLLRFQPGTYLIPGSDPSWERTVMASVLAVGPLAAASHQSAAALLRLGPQVLPVHVTTKHGTDDGRRRPFVLHRARTFTPDDIVVARRIPVTRPERTLIDLAGVVRIARLEAALDDALLRSLTTIPEVRSYIADRNLDHNRGVGLLTELLDDREDGVPESELEREFVRVCRRFRLPNATRQPYVGPFRVDFTYPGLKILIELDGRATHGSASAFEQDRVRDNTAALDDWRIRLRFTWRQMKRTPEYVATTVTDALSLARA